MNDVTASRVQRLEKWIRRNKKSLLAEDGESVSSTKLASATDKSPSYWSDVLRRRKSFGDKVARDTETALGMPPLFLEGVAWPFDDVDQERFERLTARQKGRIEQVLIEALEQIEGGESKTMAAAA